MLSYTDVQTFISNYLTNIGYTPLPVFDPGPGVTVDAIDKAPNQLVILTLTAGASLDAEQVFDRPAVQVRSIGPQLDYLNAETLAQDIDKAMVAVDQSQYINGKWVLSILRTAGAPQLLLKDDGDRYHFTCNYIWEVVY